MTPTIPADLLELEARFETWRTNRKYLRQPIPDELLNSAADLTRRYPTSLVGRVLKLDPSRRHAEALLQPRQSVPGQSRPILGPRQRDIAGLIVLLRSHHCG
jgi:hypothetical protein